MSDKAYVPPKSEYNPKNPDLFKQIEIPPEPLPDLNIVALSNTLSVVDKGDFQSKNFAVGSRGYRLREDGTLEAREGVFSGTFNIGGTIVTINSSEDIQETVDLVEAEGGGIVYLQNGTYLLNADIEIPSGVTLEGVSRDGVIINCNSAYAVKIAGSDPYSTGNVTLANGDTTVVGTGTNFTSDMVGQYILLDGLWYYISAFTDTTHITIDTYNGVDLTNSAYMIATVNFNASIKKITVTGATGSGIIGIYLMEPNFNDVVVYGCGTGLDLDYVTYPRIYGTFIENGVNMNMNYVEGYEVNFSGFDLSTVSHGVIMTQTRNSTFFNSSVNDNTGDGINMTDCSKIAFISFDMSGNGGQGIEYVSNCNDNQVVAGVFNSNTSDGIKLTATSDRNSFSQITCKNNGGYGINIAASTCDNNQIIAPAFDNNTSGNINDSGTGTVIVPNTPSYIAAEDLTVGQTVGISSSVSGKISKALRYTPTDWVNVPANFSAVENIILIDTNKFVCSYKNSSNGTHYTVVFTVTNNIITFGTAQPTGGTAGNFSESICKLDTNKFAHIMHSAPSTNYLTVNTVSGTTITNQSSANVKTMSNIAGMACCQLDTDKVGVIINNTSSDNWAAVITVSTYTPSITVENNWNESTVGYQNVRSCKINTNKFIITSAISGYAKVLEYSGGVLNLGTAVDMCSATTPTGNGSNTEVVSASNDTFWALYKGRISYGTVATRTITKVNDQAISGHSTGTLFLDGTEIIEVRYSTTANTSGLYKLTIPSSTIILTGLYYFTIGATNGCKALDSGTQYVILAQDAYHTEGMSFNFMGIVQSTVASGGSVGVITSGKIGSQTGIIPGAYYTANGLGGLSLSFTTPTTKYAIGVSSTEVML